MFVGISLILFVHLFLHPMVLAQGDDVCSPYGPPYSAVCAYFSGQCYCATLGDQSQSQTEAGILCMKEFQGRTMGQLVSVLGSSQNAFIRTLLMRNQIPNGWMGLDCSEKPCSWSDGTNATYLNLALDSVPPASHCYMMAAADGLWHKAECSTPLSFICQFTPVHAPTPEPTSLPSATIVMDTPIIITIVVALSVLLLGLTLGLLLMRRIIRERRGGEYVDLIT